MNSDIKEHEEHSTPRGLSSAESAVHERLVMTDTMQPKYEHKVYAAGFSFKCEPKDQEANVMNYLITGYPLAGKALDGVYVEFLSGEHKGKKVVFSTEMFEVE